MYFRLHITLDCLSLNEILSTCIDNILVHHVRKADVEDEGIETTVN